MDVSFASIVNFILSIGGLVAALAVVCSWLIARPASRRARAVLIAVVVFYGAISTYEIPHAIADALRAPFRPLQKADVPPGRTLVVLLGSGSFTVFDWDTARTAVLDPHGLARAAEAARVFRLVDPVAVICSGGVVPAGNPDAPLAETMSETLQHLGVPAARIIPRDGATDTHDEALMTARSLPSLHVDHVVLVTSGYHMRRATSAFRAVGIEVIPAPARDDPERKLRWLTRLLPGTRGIQEAGIVGHELLGLLYYRLRGWR